MSRATIDAALATLWSVLQTKQAKYLARTGRYFQGIETHSVPPSALTAPDRAALKPHYQSEGWVGCEITLPATMEFSLRVDQYVAPGNVPGWVATVTGTINGKIWTRSKGEGPEDRDRPWTEITPPG